MEPTILFVAFLTGLVSFLSPCIVPMIIVYLTTITGLSLRQLHSHSVRKILFLRTLAFIASFTIVFTIVGAIAGTLGNLLSSYFSLMTTLTGLLFLFLGLKSLGLLNLPHLPLKIPKSLRTSDGSLSYVGVFLVGLFFALVCSHCISLTLFPTIALAASTTSATAGALTMLAFSLGLGLPFLAVSLFLSSAIRKLRRLEPALPLLQKVAGLIFLLFALLFLTGQYLNFVSLLYRLIPFRLGM